MIQCFVKKEYEAPFGLTQMPRLFSVSRTDENAMQRFARCIPAGLWITESLPPTVTGFLYADFIESAASCRSRRTPCSGKQPQKRRCRHKR